MLVRAATRVDLAGGTLDLWPLSLLIPRAATLNCAIDLWAQARVAPAESLELVNEDNGRSLPQGGDPLEDPDFALAGECLRQFAPGKKLRLSTKTLAPRGSGLGNSSALAAAVALALTRAGDQSAVDLSEAEIHSLVNVLHNLEARVLKAPTGVQDYYPALLGGLNLLRFAPDGVVIEPLALPLDEFAARLIIFSTQQTHHSGLNNWQIYKAAVEGDAKVLVALRRIATITHELAAALAQEDFPEAGLLLSGEWAERKKLSSVVTTPAIDAMIGAAIAAGAYGAKLCGAGGGGCGIALAPPEKRTAVEAALCGAGAVILPAHPTAVGYQIEFTGAS